MPPSCGSPLIGLEVMLGGEFNNDIMLVDQSLLSLVGFSLGVGQMSSCSQKKVKVKRCCNIKLITVSVTDDVPIPDCFSVYKRR